MRLARVRPRCTSGAPPAAALSSPGVESASGRHPLAGIKIFHVNWFDSAYGGGVGVANTSRAGH